MGYVKLIDKGTTIFIYNISVEDNTDKIPSFDVILGEDILKSNDDYVDYNGTLVVSEEEVSDAISEYMTAEYPNVIDYMFSVEE
jgi:hypothetical protein